MAASQDRAASLPVALAVLLSMNVEAQVAGKPQNASDSCSPAFSHPWPSGLSRHRDLSGVRDRAGGVAK